MADPTTASREPIVLGRYLLGDVIGGGGMAVVHLARALGAAGFSRVVAIKRVLPGRAADPRAATMLVDEARMASRIRHPNVVTTLDVLEAGGEVLLVMEYVHGVTLSQLVRLAAQSARPVPPRVAARIVLDVLAGLGAAHAATSERGRPLELVHRDVSPQNILVDTDGVVRLADFGIAKATSRIGVTREGEIKGKLAYMAPEQLRGGEVDRRADLYATGIVLWELLAGRRLFEGRDADLAAALRGALEGKLTPVSAQAGLDAAVDVLLARALAASPGDRFADAAQMASALSAAMPRASAAEVAAFATELGGPLLAARSALVNDVEQLSQIHPAPGAPAVDVHEAARLETAPTEVGVRMDQHTAPLPTVPLPSPPAPARAGTPPRTRWSRFVVLSVVAVVAVLLVLGSLFGRRLLRPNRWDTSRDSPAGHRRAR